MHGQIFRWCDDDIKVYLVIILQHFCQMNHLWFNHKNLIPSIWKHIAYSQASIKRAARLTTYVVKQAARLIETWEYCSYSICHFLRQDISVPKMFRQANKSSRSIKSKNLRVIAWMISATAYRNAPRTNLSVLQSAKAREVGIYDVCNGVDVISNLQNSEQSL